MNWLNKIQAKSQAEKLRIIWAVVIIVAMAMIIVWVISAKYYKKVGKDTTLFRTIGNGIKDVKENYNKK